MARSVIGGRSPNGLCPYYRLRRSTSLAHARATRCATCQYFSEQKHVEKTEPCHDRGDPTDRRTSQVPREEHAVFLVPPVPPPDRATGPEQSTEDGESRVTHQH